MSNRHEDTTESQLVTALRFVLRQALKGIATALPAAVKSWTRTTRRAEVQPLVRVVLTDGNERSRPLVPNAPVLFPGGGGYMLTFPLAEDDEVLRVACERGLAGWKRRKSGEATPDEGVMLSESASVVIPGLGPYTVVQGGDGACLQSVDGGVYVEIRKDGDAGRIRMRLGAQDVTLTDAGLSVDVDGDVAVRCTGKLTLAGGDVVVDGDVAVRGGGLTHDGADVGSSHRHRRVKPGGGVSGEPA